MRLIKLVPDGLHLPFLRFRHIMLVVSLLAMAASIALPFVRGLNFGIDFKGGILIEIATPGAADLEALRADLGGLGLGDVSIQGFGAPNDVLIRLGAQGEGEAQQVAIDKVRASLAERYGADVEYRRVETVGPVVSGELIEKGALAIGLALVAILIYIWFRFEWQFGLGALASLIHDVVLTIGFFSVTQLEFNLAVVAAILTIVGYSLNDTVVVYDRIREYLRKYRSLSMIELIDNAMNDTLNRTLMTSFTTLLAVLALYIFGGPVIQGFTAALIWGVFIGTYSSIFVAAPVLVWLNIRRDSFIPEDARDVQP